MTRADAFAAGTLKLVTGDALIIVDVQRDFLPGGSLAVPSGQEVIGPLNRIIKLFEAQRLPVFATRDWHPANHASFRSEGGSWPPHCIAGSAGAQFSPDLDLPRGATVVSKATEREVEAYSGFEKTGLEVLLKEAGVKRVVIGGLATDYCVLRTVTDAVRFGFKVFLLADAVRAVNIAPRDGEKALDEMKNAGAEIIVSGDLTE